MITAGIDIGHQSVNAVILEDDKILTHNTIIISGEVENAARVAFEKLLDQSGMNESNIEKLINGEPL